jgi:hypothetical protein
MKHLFRFLLIVLMTIPVLAQEGADPFPEEKVEIEKKEFRFIGYYFVRSELNNIAPTNEFLKGQVVGRIFGGNTTRTSKATSAFTEQRFIPIIAYTPRLFDGWATMRMSFEFDWAWGDANYGAGGNFGGAFGADAVNMQTQNLFIEFRPQKNFFLNIGLTRLFDNVSVPAYTLTPVLLNTGYRLAFWGSDASGIAAHYLWPGSRIKAGAYQLYENNVEQNDDVSMFEIDYEYDLDIRNSIGLSFWYVRDRANGEGGVSILGQGLNSGLNNYNGVFNFNFGNKDYKADVYWLGTHFHGNPLLNQGRFGYNGFAVMNFGTTDTLSTNSTYAAGPDIMGFAGNLRLAYKYGKNANDQVSVDAVFTSGDGNNISDGTYSGVLTGNNWTAPGAVFFGHGLYLLLPHGNVVNRFNGATIDIQNLGYGIAAAAVNASYDIIPNKFKIKGAFGLANSMVAPPNVDGYGTGNYMGTEVNLNLLYRPKVYMDLELHAAYLKLGDFFDSRLVNGDNPNRPLDPWTVFATLKWIMF